VDIAVPAGWTATPTTPTSYDQVPANSAVTVKWTVSPGSSVAPGTYPITFTATSSEGTVSSSAEVKVPYASVAAAYNNTGISNDNAPAAGAFDGSGLNYSAQALAAAGFNAGQDVTAGGIGFTWPGTNVPDNVVARVRLPGGIVRNVSESGKPIDPAVGVRGPAAVRPSKGRARTENTKR